MPDSMKFIIVKRKLYAHSLHKTVHVQVATFLNIYLASCIILTYPNLWNSRAYRHNRKRRQAFVSECVDEPKSCDKIELSRIFSVKNLKGE